HLPGHGHCDSLSFEWWVRGRPVVVDTGTLSYERGAARAACRSTRAHNTLEIDGREQHEMWAAFRVARRAAVTARLVADGLEATLVRGPNPQLRIAPRFEGDEEVIRIDDIVPAPGTHAITSRIHLHPDCEIEREGEHVRLKQGNARAEIRVPAAARILGPAESRSVHCSEIGVGRPNAVIEVVHDGALPWRAPPEPRESR